MAVRNSEALEVFLQVAADSRVSWRAVELAGRGIAADAAGVIWVMSAGKLSLDGEKLTDLLIEQGDLVDALADSWRSFDGGDISGTDFEMRLEGFVLGLEGWISRAAQG
ncbi:hypothetical protein [Streptomyces camelliae]|uniref:Uncharacterized protein n=1 Tax=Streptomyces camelliae TaxID=3004093 RepID=A0ABY7P456_9ACTN|nr:hypothetical protein [Streptomyces sp. HUAS 2-6]WBO64309.1 hypothetical protein O1G22_16455 [Streptomyces sp. HUAS 2-6]